MSHAVNSGSGSGSGRTSILPPNSVKGQDSDKERTKEEGPADGLGKRTASMRFKSSFSFLGMSSSKASRQTECASASRHGSATSTFTHTHTQIVPCSTERGESGDVKRSSVNKMMSSLIKKLNFGPSHSHSSDGQNLGPGSTADSSTAVSRGEEG